MKRIGISPAPIFIVAQVVDKAIEMARNIMAYNLERERIQVQRENNERQAEITLEALRREHAFRMSELHEYVNQINLFQNKGEIELRVLTDRRDEMLRASLILMDRSMDPACPPDERELARGYSRILKDWHLALGTEQFDVFDRMAANVERFIAKNKQEDAQ